MSSRSRRDALIKAIVQADDVKGDIFFTASSFDGTALLHDGLPDGQMEVDMGDVLGLATRGLIAITEQRPHGDVAFAVTEAGRSESQRIERGGLSDVEVERARADQAEFALEKYKEAAKADTTAIELRRERLASRLARLPAVLVALAFGWLLFQLSDVLWLRAGIGILLAVGVAGSWLYAPARRLATTVFVRILRALHDVT